jgi:glycosyltransferase involved in cell wall biosynthesis
MSKAKKSAKSMGAPTASIVIPCYNEESLLEEAVREMVAKLEDVDWTYEIIIAENGSSDRTLEIARELSEEFPQLKAMKSPEPDYGLALRLGIKMAQGTYVLCDEIDICDVDFQQRAMDILQPGGADMVVGSKRHKDAQDERPLGRRAATMIINMMLRVSLGFKGTDTHGLKAFHREKILAVVDQCIVNKDLFASELVIRAERGEFRVVEIPVTIIEKRKPSINLVRRVPNVLKNLARLVVAIRFNKEV